MAKKTFKAALASGSGIGNPAEALITGAAAAGSRRAETKTSPLQATPYGTDTADRKEAKSRRLQSLLKPSLYDYLKRSALSRGISVNDRLNAILEAAKTEEG